MHVEDKKAWSSYLLTTSINQFNNKSCYRPWYLYTISLLGYGALPRTCLPARSVSMQWSVQGLLSPSGKPAWKPQDTSKGGALWGWKKAEWPGTCVFLLVLAWGQSALPSAKLLGLAVCWDMSCSWKWHDRFYGSGVLENVAWEATTVPKQQIKLDSFLFSTLLPFPSACTLQRAWNSRPSVCLSLVCSFHLK